MTKSQNCQPELPRSCSPASQSNASRSCLAIKACTSPRTFKTLEYIHSKSKWRPKSHAVGNPIAFCIHGFLLAPLLFATIIPRVALAQGTFRYDGTVTDTAGEAIAGAHIAICAQPANTTNQPCSPLAAVYADPRTTTYNIPSISCLNDVVTVTTSVTNYIPAGQSVTIAGVANPAFDGTFITAGRSDSAFSYAHACKNGSSTGGTVRGANPLLSDASGHYHFYIGTGTYTLQIYSAALATRTILQDQSFGAPSVPNILGSANSWTGVQTFKHNVTATDGQNAFNAYSLIGAIVVDGNKYPQTDVGIQSAINAAPAGGTLILPAATYSACDNLPITITKSLNIVGQGWGINRTSTRIIGSVIRVCPGLSTSTNVFAIAPPKGIVQMVRMQDFAITNDCASLNACSPNPPGQYGIYINGAVGYLGSTRIDGMFIGPFNGQSIHCDGSGSGQGCMAISTIQDNNLEGGIQLLTAGDTIRIINNKITDNFPNHNTIGVDVTPQVGSAVLTVQGNNITNGGGGIHLGADIFAPVITDNEIETESGFTGSNSALIDCDGAGSAYVQNAIIKHNSLQVINTSATFYGVRLNYCKGATVSDNSFERGGYPGSADVFITANAKNNFVGHNMWGTPLSGAVSNSGTNTHAVLLPFGEGITYIDDGGTQRVLARSMTGGSTGFQGYHGTNALVAAKGATYLYDGAPGSNIALATSDTASSDPVSSTVVSVANLALQNLALSRTTPAITSGFGTSPNIIQQNGTVAFEVNVGSGGTATSGVIGLPKATNGWNCFVTDETSPTALTRQTANTTTSATFTNYNYAGTATAWTADDILIVSCFAR